MNGVVQDLRLVNGHLFVVGSFTTVGRRAAPRASATLDPTTGARRPVRERRS